MPALPVIAYPVSAGSSSGPRRAELAHGSGIERVAQSECAEPPEGVEREVVEGEDRGAVAPCGPAHGVRRRVGLTVHLVGQEVETFANGEARLDERFAFCWSHRAREHLVISRRPRPLDAIENRGPAEGGVGCHHQMGDMTTASPRAEPGPGVPEAKGLLSHGHMQG